MLKEIMNKRLPLQLNRITLCGLTMLVSASFILSCDSEPHPPAPTSDMSAPPEEVEHVWEVEASFSESVGVVMSVWGSSESPEWGEASVWAVGGQPEQGKMWRRGAPDWSPETIPDGPLLNWVHGVKGHLWVVGNEGRALRKVMSSAGGDGAWQTFETGTTQDLWGVWARSPNEVWAVGGDPTGEGEVDPVITFFNGEVWRRIEVPMLDRGGVRSLFKVYGDQDQVFAVGMKGVILGGSGESGGTWRQYEVTSKDETPPSSEDLVSLWGRGDDLLAVGGRSNGVLARWDGEQWRSTILAGVPGLNGVWMDGRGHATTVGVRGASLRVTAGSLSGDRERTQTQLVLHAVWGRAGEIWAVGGSLNSSPPWEGLIIRTPH